MAKQRIDLLLVEQGLVESRSLAQRLIMAGQIRVAGQVVQKASESFPADVVIEIESLPQYVSRGGEKLEGAFEQFNLTVQDKVCVDVGSSTGGFTDCLLQNGAVRVFAIDVGKGILHWKIRQDPRVVVMEETNARNVDSLPEPIDFVTIDASFISLKIILPVIKTWFAEEAQMIALIKPQFEAGRKEASRTKGVIRDPAVHRRVLADILNFAEGEGYQVYGLGTSPIKGPKGNIEFLAWLGWGRQRASIDIQPAIQRVISSPNP